MQPYFFPYLGYFDLIFNTDRWVVFDVTQYTPKSWMNRNRMLHPNEGWLYITAPVAKFRRFSAIKDIQLKNVDETRDHIKRQLEHYRKRAPFYWQTLTLLDDAFARRSGDSLTEVNIAGLVAVCEYLGVDFRYEVCSQMGLDLPEIHHPGQWALEISAAMGAREYINPPGGRDIFRPEEFQARNIRLGFTRTPDFTFPTPGYDFIPYLSILDTLMWNSPEDITRYFEKTKETIDYA